VAPITREQRFPAVLFPALISAERLYRYAQKAVGILKEPLLWPMILLFLPKINLLGFRNETAGIRLDDIVLMMIAGCWVVDWIGRLELTIEPVPLAGFTVVCLFCLSNLVNSGMGHSSFLYSFRLAEYMIFFWSGKYLLRRGYDFDLLVKALILLNFAVTVLQYAGLIGGFATLGYESDVGRPYGLSANHPAEMGALINLLYAALVFGDNRIKFWRWSLLVGVFAFLTGSRSSLLAHFVLMLIYIYRHSKNKPSFVIKTAVIAAIPVAVLIAVPNNITSRSADLFSFQNVDTFRDVYNSIPVDRQFADVSEGGAPEDSPEGVDISWYMRGYKWAEVVKTMSAQPWTIWILGVGPGGIGIALDGGWLRLIVETGIVGSFAFLYLLRRISRLGAACSMAVFALAVNMVMIDSHLAYKVMAFLFFLAGTQVQIQLERSTTGNLNTHSRLGTT